MYQLAYITRPTGQIDYIKYTTDTGAMFSIPIAEDNTDYQNYLVWLSEGNTPLPVDEQGTPA